MSDQELFQVILASLSGVPLALHDDEDKRVYLAFLCARLGMGAGDALTGARVSELREELHI